MTGSKLKKKSEAIDDLCKKYCKEFDNIKNIYITMPREVHGYPYSTRTNFLKMEIYKLIRKTLRRKYGREVIVELVKRSKFDPLNVSFSDNEFYWGILAGDTDEEPFKKRKRSEYAKEMAYANEHEIPPFLLVGFLHQAGGTKRIAKKLRAQEHEPWFRKDGSTTVTFPARQSASF